MPAEPMPAAGDDVEELRRQVEVLRLENAVMRETIDVLKADDPRLDPSMLTCFASMFVRQVRQCFSAVWADGFPRCRHRFPVM